MTGMREERRQQIIEAAITVFGNKGYHRAKIEEIAIKAEIGKSTIYEYFISKKELFEEMIIFIVEDYISQIEIILNDISSCREKLIAFAKNYGNFINNHVALAENTISASGSITVSSGVKKEIKRWKMQVFYILEEIFKLGINSEELRNDVDTKIATIIAIGSINEYYGMQLLIKEMNPTKVDPTPIVDMLYRTIKK